jgi:hypothetical protein
MDIRRITRIIAHGFFHAPLERRDNPGLRFARQQRCCAEYAIVE